MDATKDPKDISSVHFIGIGGAGMSGIALVLHERGCAVSGSDLKSSHYVRELEEAGIEVYVGHEASTIDAFSPELVVVSSAIPDTNPEVIRAHELGIPVWPRAKMLSYLSAGALTVAVAGTHGKTTTSSMIATMLDRVGLDPSFLIGGIVEGYETNGRNGNGGYFVCEADESDGSFLYLNPSVAVVTNIEEDHLDHYGTLENIEKAFCDFMSLVGNAGSIVVFGDNPHYVELAKSTGRRVVSYGFGQGVDYRCTPGATHGIESSCTIKCPTGKIVSVSIKANPGEHNLGNATAAIAVADILGCDLDEAAAALSTFEGARRRFTHVGDVAGITVVDDYGHHPTEIKLTLEAASRLDFKRVVCVFQPHRYSRTRDLEKEWGRAFNAANVLLVMDVFPAGEMAIPGVSGKTVVNQVKLSGTCEHVAYVPNRKTLIELLLDICEEGDLLITQGAGDVTSMGPAFITAKEEQLAQAEDEKQLSDSADA